MKKTVLVLAPHNDDETLGCGATIAKHADMGDDVYVATLTSIEDGHPVMKPNKDVIRAETIEAMRILGVPRQNIIFRDLPDVLYVPFMYDLHKDHREILYAAQVAARTCTPTGRKIKEIYMYETLSETHWNIDHTEGGFLPNVFNNIEEYIDKKVEAVKAYKSQLKTYPDVRCVEAIKALALFRGSVMGMEHAEAFVLVRKLM